MIDFFFFLFFFFTVKKAVKKKEREKGKKVRYSLLVQKSHGVAKKRSVLNASTKRHCGNIPIPYLFVLEFPSFLYVIIKKRRMGRQQLVIKECASKLPHPPELPLERSVLGNAGDVHSTVAAAAVRVIAAARHNKPDIVRRHNTLERG